MNPVSISVWLLLFAHSLLDYLLLPERESSSQMSSSLKFSPSVNLDKSSVTDLTKGSLLLEIVFFKGLVISSI